MIETLALLYFPLLMALAASSDLLTMKIPNRLVMLLLGGFVVLAFAADLSFQDMVAHLSAGAMVLVVAFAFFAFGWIGGGDAKLAAATALWLGLAPTVAYLVLSALLGGAMTLVILAVRRVPLPPMLMRVDWIHRLHDPRTGIPYGIALAAGGLVVYSDTVIFRAFAA